MESNTSPLVIALLADDDSSTATFSDLTMRIDLAVPVITMLVVMMATIELLAVTTGLWDRSA